MASLSKSIKFAEQKYDKVYDNLMKNYIFLILLMTFPIISYADSLDTEIEKAVDMMDIENRSNIVIGSIKNQNMIRIEDLSQKIKGSLTKWLLKKV